MKAARQRLEQAEETLRAAIVLAQKSGESIRDIAPYAGLSPARIHQILRKAARDE